VKLALAFAVVLSGCSPAYYAATKRCPTTQMLIGDLVLGGAALAVSTIKWNAGKEWESLAYTTGAGAVFLGANLAEVRACKR
jgi:hypothetical protein